MNKIYLGDCLEVMKDIEDHSIDMILCDLPYGTTACKWDVIIPFDLLWKQYKRIIMPGGAIVLTASQPFTTVLISSNMKMFKYCWVWNKHIAGNPFLAKKQPMKIHEDICVFYKKPPIYNPQMWDSGIPKRRGNGGYSKLYNHNIPIGEVTTMRYPLSIIDISLGNRNKKEIVNHPTQKPVSLFEYLIKTYTHEGDLVLDNVIGSGTTAIACINTNRRFIGIEKDRKYYEIARKRINEL